MRKLVIIPTYNERENISAMIDKVFSLPDAFDLLVIDDGSPDGTAAIVRSRQADKQISQLRQFFNKTEEYFHTICQKKSKKWR